MGAAQVHRQQNGSFRQRPERPRRRRGYLRPWLTAAPFLAPALVILLVFEVWPILFGFWMSLWRWGVTAERFVGLENYLRLFTQELLRPGWDGRPELGELGQSLVVTGWYALFTVPLALVISFAIALALSRRLSGRGLFRTVFFLPYVTSHVAAAMVFRWIFHPQVGVANAVLMRLGLPPQQWLLDGEPVLLKLLRPLGLYWPAAWPELLAGPSLALVVVILFSVWSSLGFDIAIFLAALGQVPRELHDAARIDGASRWQLFRHVTLPLASPTAFFLLTLSTIRSLQSFTHFYALVGGDGSPLGTTYSLTIAIFHNFYDRSGATGYAAAFSFVLFALILALTLIQFRVVGRRVHYTGG